jgi:hypothetical protein
MKLELLTNVTVVYGAIRFVSSNKSKDKENPKSLANDSEYDNEILNKSDYNEHDEDQLEEEQEEEAGEITLTTTNQVF